METAKEILEICRGCLCFTCHADCRKDTCSICNYPVKECEDHKGDKNNGNRRNSEAYR